MSEEKRGSLITSEIDSYLFLRRYQPDQVLRDRVCADSY